jgi:hypothetical protein
MRTSLVCSSIPSGDTSSEVRRPRRDPLLDAVIHSKPPNDPVPKAVWRVLADCLEHSALVSADLDGAQVAPGFVRFRSAKRATSDAESALAELHAPPPQRSFRAVTAQASPLHLTIRSLARLIVTDQRTPTAVICDAIHAHLAVLSDKLGDAPGAWP